MESIERRVVRRVRGLYIESHEELGMVSSVKIVRDAVEERSSALRRPVTRGARRHVLGASESGNWPTGWRWMGNSITRTLVQHQEELSESQSCPAMEWDSRKGASFLTLEYPGRGWMCTYQNVPE